MREVFIDFENRVGIAAAPDVAIPGLIAFFFWLRHGRYPETGEMRFRDAQDWGLTHPVERGFSAGVPIIAIHQDPYERLRCAYEKRALGEPADSPVSFREFCGEIGKARKGPFVEWHTYPQENWLGSARGPYAAILGVKDLHLLPSLLKRITGRHFPDIQLEHRRAEESPWEPGLRELLAPWVNADLAAGWNGETPDATYELAGVARFTRRQGPSVAMPGAVQSAIHLKKYADGKDWGWYRMVPAAWLRWVASRHPAKVLEIGAHDGVSANVMLDTIFPHPDSTVDTIDPYLPDPSTPNVGTRTRELFDENKRRGGHGDQLRLHVGTSREVLVRMLADGGKESYDVIFIDGSHLAPDVMTDAVLAWSLLKPGGILIFDDFEWGARLPKHRRPREAILAFEAAFVESLVPLWQGYQRIYRRTGLPGGLRDRAGDLLRINVVIVGTYNSGSSLLSSILECLGFEIGRPAWYDFSESASLREVVTSAIDERTMTAKVESGQLIVQLNQWLAQVKPSAPALCVKHPLLGLCLAEVDEAWGAETLFIRTRRPLEQSIRCLQRRNWFPEPERMQRTLHEEIEAFFSGGRPCLSVEYGNLLARPNEVIRSLAEQLGISTGEAALERAVQLVEPRKSTS